MRVLREFLSDWKTTGAVAPTSRFTQRVMADCIDWSRVRTMVELGPGTGCVTRALLQRLRPDARLVAVEINPRFVEEVRRSIDDPRLQVVQGSAADLSGILRRLGMEPVDCVVSVLPFASLPPTLRDEVMGAVCSGLRPGGTFVAIQYTNLVMPKLMEAHLGSYRVKRSWLNLPPALVYTCALSDRGA